MNCISTEERDRKERQGERGLRSSKELEKRKNNALSSILLVRQAYVLYSLFTSDSCIVIKYLICMDSEYHRLQRGNR